MTKEVHRRKVKIVDRVMINDLLVSDGQVVGAVGYGTRDGCMHVFHAKAKIMAAGWPNRLYKPFSGKEYQNCLRAKELNQQKNSAMKYSIVRRVIHGRMRKPQFKTR